MKSKILLQVTDLFFSARFKPSCDWSPAYHNETYNGKNMTLIVWFSAPPAEFKMVEYEIGLKPTPRDVYRNQNKIVNSVSHYKC